MRPPSYARATLSSELKASPKPGQVEHQALAQTTPKKLKRPSTLSIEDRQSISYNSDLYHIIKKDPAKPCRLADMPSEIRTTIYAHVLEQHGHIQHPRVRHTDRRYQYWPSLYMWPSLLHICRAMRIEAAYTYYTSTPFTFNVERFDFSDVRRWVEMLPVAHRALLSKNQDLTINVEMDMGDTYTYPPKDWLFDASMEDHWKACQNFGNLYSISDGIQRKKFILFCRLATWWLWCGQPIYQNIEWKYQFQEEFFGWNFYRVQEEPSVYRLAQFLKRCVVCFALPSVCKTWTRRTREKDMFPEAISFLNALENKFDKLFAKERVDMGEKEEIRRIFSKLRKTAGKWEHGERYQYV